MRLLIPIIFQAMTTFEIAQALGQIKDKHQVTCTEKGYFYENGNRISKERAAEILASFTLPAKPASWTFERLNVSTQAFFYQLCEQILEATKDASASCGVQIGKDIPRIGLENAPRLTNLKRAGMFEHAGKGWLQLTEYGRAVFLATV